LSNDGYIKAVGEHKTRKNQTSVGAQWAAEAIAATQYNNNVRSTRHLPSIDHTITRKLLHDGELDPVTL